MNLQTFKKVTDKFSNTDKMPLIFIGHGSPMNGIEDNEFSRGWQVLGGELPRPNAILSISAHWYTQGTFVHVAEKPRTIYDFYGFPEELYNIKYNSPGAPEIAKEVKMLLASHNVLEDHDWGIDHGTWIVLLRMYPNHDIPVFQLSIDLTRSVKWHYELASLLKSLRRKGVLIMGSGNIVHNLGLVNFDNNSTAYDWAIEFDKQCKDLILNNDHKSLIDYQNLGEAAKLSIPTPDHYLPLMYILGLKEKGENIVFPVEGMSHGSVSMRSIRIG